MPCSRLVERNEYRLAGAFSLKTYFVSSLDAISSFTSVLEDPLFACVRISCMRVMREGERSWTVLHSHQKGRNIRPAYDTDLWVYFHI